MLKILHLNSYYVDTHLYSKIYKKLSDTCFQTVYIPLKQNRKEENKMVIQNTELIYSKIIEKYHSIFYFAKIAKLFKDVVNKKIYEGSNVIHAHNLFIDGAVAYKLKKKYGMRYVVSIRMTDISLQYKFMLHRRFFAKRILKEADSIIFISPHYKNMLWSMVGRSLVDELEEKTYVIPNGIDDFWLENSIPKTPYHNKTFNLLFIGQIIKRKNLHKVLDCLSELNKSDIKYNLTIVGGEHANEKEYFNEIKNRIDLIPYVQYKGAIKDHFLLQNEIGRNHALIMPSVRELFGLVFIEALSQNTPVVYPIDEGISPYLKDLDAGVPVDPTKVLSISDGIERMKRQYNKFNFLSEKIKQFDWSIITNQYNILYKNNNNE